MVGMRIRHPYDLRDDTYRTVTAEFSQARSREEAGGARVRLRTSAAHRSGLAITFRQAPSSNSSCCPQPHQGPCLRWWDYGCSGSLQRRGTLALATRTKGERPRFDERLTLGELEPSSVGRKERRCNARSICYRLSLRMIPSNTIRRV